MLQKRGLTITLCYHLSNRVQAFCCAADVDFEFDEENRNRTNCPEVILYPAFGSDTAFDERFRNIPDSKFKHRDKATKDLRASINLLPVQIGLHSLGTRTGILPVPFRAQLEVHTPPA